MMKWFLLFVVALLVLVVPADASCNATVPYVFSNGLVADATQVNANYNAITTGMSSTCAGSGVNSDITSLAALSNPLTPAQGGTSSYFGGTSAGAANVQTIASTTPTSFALSAGRTVWFIPGYTNTSAMTLAVNGLAAKNVYKAIPGGAVALVGGEVVAGVLTSATYDGTEFILGSYNAWVDGPTATIASATTTDVGSVASHSIVISGTTTITSLGSSASVSLPHYSVCFSGVLTLTYNASSLVLPGSATITTASGDCMWVKYTGSGNWYVESYFRASGVPLTILTNSIGYSQTWQSPTRATNGTVYTNSTSLPIQVNVSVALCNACSSYMYVSGVQVAHTFMAGTAANNSIFFMSAIVPVGSTYNVNGGTLDTWAELR